MVGKLRRRERERERVWGEGERALLVPTSNHVDGCSCEPAAERERERDASERALLVPRQIMLMVVAAKERWRRRSKPRITP